MRIITFSDTHFRKYVRVESSTVDWLSLQLESLDKVFQYCEEVEPDLIIFNGDLFDAKSTIDVSVFSQVLEKFYEFPLTSRLIINTGNHDIATVQGDSVLKAFEPICKRVIGLGEVNEITWEDWNICIVPYSCFNLAEERRKREKYNILFLHEEIQELALSASNYKLSSSVEMSALEDWDYVFDGHIHKPQEVCRELVDVYAIGSLVQQNFSEEKEEKRLLDIEIEGDECNIRSVPIDGPKFYNNLKLEDKIIKYIEEKSRSDEFFLFKIRKKEVSHEIFKRPNVFYRVVQEETRKVRVEEDKTDEELVDVYAKEYGDDDVYDRLIEIGKRIIRECM